MTCVRYGGSADECKPRVFLGGGIGDVTHDSFGPSFAIPVKTEDPHPGNECGSPIID